jgi:deoxyinosine 3'endonuclease (endonuclease V)
MIYCFDTYYFEDKANTACVGVEAWNDKHIAFEAKQILSDVADYESGAFYKRELPCLLSLLKTMELNTATDIIVVDGYVVLRNGQTITSCF